MLTRPCVLQVSVSQPACGLTAASLKSCSASIFVEHYIAVTVRALDAIRKQTPAATDLPHIHHMWTIIAAAFTRCGMLCTHSSCRSHPAYHGASHSILALCQDFLTHHEAKSLHGNAFAARQHHPTCWTVACLQHVDQGWDRPKL